MNWKVCSNISRLFLRVNVSSIKPTFLPSHLAHRTTIESKSKSTTTTSIERACTFSRFYPFRPSPPSPTIPPNITDTRLLYRGPNQCPPSPNSCLQTHLSWSPSSRGPSAGHSCLKYSRPRPGKTHPTCRCSFPDSRQCRQSPERSRGNRRGSQARGSVARCGHAQRAFPRRQCEFRNIPI